MNETEQWLHNKIIELSESTTGGYVTGKDIKLWLLKEQETQCSLKTVYNTLHRLGFSWITSRSIHPKSSPEEQ